MAYSNEILLGRITKVSGYEGAVTVKLEKAFFENIPHMESVFLEIEGKPVPFFISESEYSGAGSIKLKFDDYDTSGKVEEFINCRVFLTSGMKAEDPGQDTLKIAGYRVFTKNDELLGTVRKIIQNPGQWLLSIESLPGKEILVPFHEDLILSIDNATGILVMDLPEGLIDLN